jgi:hypothetical protein
MGNKTAQPAQHGKGGKGGKFVKRTIQVLLLGAGESGKSTIFKQMKIIHHNGYTSEEKIGFKPIIQGNIVRNIKSIISASLSLGIAIENPENRVRPFYFLPLLGTCTQVGQHQKFRINGN